jgi:hypothetical protein
VTAAPVSAANAAAGVRLDLARIEAALRTVQAAREPGGAGITAPRDPMDENVVGNMLAGYAYIEWLVRDGIDPFARGQVKHLLELNCLVLCGTDEARRARYAGHLAATEKRFYEERDAGIEDVVEWQRLQKGLPVWEQAAAAYLRILCKPQLFIEGNHRSAALVMSYVLLREGEPPFVLTAANAAEYFAASSGFRDVRRSGLAALFRLPILRRRFAELLRRESRAEYLRRG